MLRPVPSGAIIHFRHCRSRRREAAAGLLQRRVSSVCGRNPLVIYRLRSGTSGGLSGKGALAPGEHLQLPSMLFLRSYQIVRTIVQLRSFSSAVTSVQPR